MHKLYFSFLLTIFLCITGTTAFAHDIQVKNSDGVTIYYVRTNNNKELAVSYMGNSWQSLKNHYSGNVVIPETVTYNGNTYSVTSIEGRAFTSCSSLTSITIPNSVTKIGMYAFYGCSGLTSIIIPNSVASIEYAAYENCSGLTSVMIPSSVTSIEHGAFRGCTGLTSITIPNSVTSIGSSAFRDCTGLTSITIPNSVTSIGSGAFSGCTGLTSIIIPNSVTSIEANPFSDCSSLTSLIVASGNTKYDSRNNCNAIIETSSNRLIAGLVISIIPNSVTSIGSSAFSGCTDLTSVKIPDSVTSIGSGAFSYCTGLTSITIPNSVTSIGSNAFYHCTSLTSVTISNSVTSIERDAFSYCTGLTSITIPNSVTSIGRMAFYYCTGLTSVTIPSSVTSIEDAAFSGCTGLTSVHISDLVAWCRINFGSNPLIYAHHLFMNGTEIKDLVIPNSVTSIGSSAFRDCTGLTSVTIPNSVTSIGASAFYYCTGLTSITIPNSVTSIGSNAFFGCESLTSITIPNSVRVIGYGAFYGCKGLKTVYSFSDTYFSEDVFCYEYWGPTSIEFPSILDTNLQSATLYVKYALINDFKRSWRNFGFYKSLDATSFNGVIYLITDSVNNYAQVFKADKPNNVINIEPSIEIFGSLYKVTSIADNVFKDVESITSLVIPESVKDIGNNAFSGCRNLVTVELGKNVTTIGERAFANIDKLTDLVIPENVKDIGNNAFSGCRNLVTIELGKNVTTIGERAFANIDKLTDVICYAENVPETDRTAFENSYIDYVTLHVPAGSVEKYKNSAPWKDFKKIVAISGAEMKYTLTYMVDGVIYKTYELSEGDAITPEAAPTKEGYMFSGWSEIPQTMPSHDVTINGYFEFDTNTTDVILCDNLQCISGSTPILKVGLTNTNEVKLCQFDLQLPVGVTVVTKSNGKLDAKLTERAETHSVSSKQLENGNYRFVISSLDNDSFTGNSGTLMEITLDISSTMEAGEYIVKVINAELSVPDGNDLKVVKPADTESKLTINNYTPGDVNNDGSVSVTDVGCAINYILEQIPSVFVFEAADMNGDNTVSVTDVGMIINLILNDGASSRRRSSEGNDSETSLLPQINLLSTAEGYELRLEDKDAYIGFQFDMALGDDAVINSIQLNGSANDDHLLTYRRLSNGKWRVVCYSPTNSTFSNDDSVLLTITATSSISVSDICLTTSGLNELHPSNLFGMPTGIANVDKTNSKTTFKLYSLGGNIYRVFNMRSGVNSFDGLRPGIYLIDNKKIVIR